MSSDKKVSEGYYHCLDFFEKNYKKATLEQKNYFIMGVITLRDFLEGK
jgi:hypothetical protein